MDHNNLKSMWQSVHNTGMENHYNPESIHSVILNQHSPVIKKLLNSSKLKMAVYIFSLLTIVGLLIYAFAFLGIVVTTGLVVPFALGGLFLLILLSSEYSKYLTFISINDNAPVLRSDKALLRKVHRIKNIEFILFIIVFYSMSLSFLIFYTFDIGGLRDDVLIADLAGLLITFCFLLLIIPWFIRFSLDQQYRKLVKLLKKNIRYLEREG